MPTVPVEVKKTVPARKAKAPVPDAWQSLRSEMDRVFDRFASGFGFPSVRPFDFGPLIEWDEVALAAPAMDITEDASAYKMTAELPGLTEKDVEVAVQGDMLTVKGEKKRESERKEQNVYLAERSYGAFSRSFTLPEGVDAGAIGASFANGVLTLTLPKKPEAKAETKKIEVKPAA